MKSSRQSWIELSNFMANRVMPNDPSQWRQILQLLDSDQMRPPSVTVNQQVVLEWSYDGKYLEIIMNGNEFSEFFFRDDKHKTVTENEMNCDIQSIRQFIHKEFPALEGQLTLLF